MHGKLFLCGVELASRPLPDSSDKAEAEDLKYNNLLDSLFCFVSLSLGSFSRSKFVIYRYIVFLFVVMPRKNCFNCYTQFAFVICLLSAYAFASIGNGQEFALEPRIQGDNRSRRLVAASLKAPLDVRANRPILAYEHELQYLEGEFREFILAHTHEYYLDPPTLFGYWSRFRCSLAR